MDRVVGRILELNKRDLVGIYSNLNGYRWDERLGGKPHLFDEMPDYNRDNYFFSKHRIIKPYLRLIEKKTSERARYKYHHLIVLERSRFQFEIYWINRLYRTKLRGFSI